jgi:inner membrane protease ATP23
MADENIENQNSGETPSKSDDYDGWGFDLFPERRGTFKPTIKNILFQGRGNENVERMKCENKVAYCLNKSITYI